MTEKMKSVIREITLNEATFHGQVIEPTYVNFFYGRNGAGKSTVARAIEHNDGLEWQNGHVADDFDVLVYSQDFINRNFATYGNLRGVFTISETNIEIQKQVEEKSNQKNELEAKAGNYTEEKTKKDGEQFVIRKTFEDGCWKKTRDICDTFKDAVKGTGTKKLFADAVLSVKTPKEYNLEALAKLYHVAYNSKARTYNLFSRVSGAPSYGKLPGHDLMDKIVVSSSKTPFAKFIKALNASDWVRQGHQHYSKDAAGRCPYCQQKLPANFESEIAACFDEEYQQDISEITRFQSVYTRETSAIIEKLKLNLDDTMPTLDLAEYQNKLKLLESNVKINEQRIAEKAKEPTSVVSLEDIDSLLIDIGQLIDEINKKIKANNDVVGTRQQKKEECKNALWSHIAFLLQEEISSYKTSTTKVKNEAEEFKNKVVQAHKDVMVLSKNITELNKQVVNTKAAVDSINDLLRDSGFQGFSLREKKGVQNVYEVIREDGSIAENLSEGERNFIAFLYFYHMVKGSRNSDVVKDKVVVIDDPVSSMDSSALFIVSAIVREMITICNNNAQIKDDDIKGTYIKQLFVLTHNVYFHKEVTYHQVQRYRNVSFYVIQKVDNVSTVKLCERQCSEVPSEMENYNPVQSSYAALWNELKELDSPIPLLNVMRRILEYYFMQLYGYEGDDLRKRVLEDNKPSFIVPGATEDDKPDNTKYNLASAMLSYISNPNGISDGLNFTEDYANVDQYKETFREIFYALHQEQHYKMMMGIQDDD
jgi:wobble nucleotide-excising tRNase